MSETRPACDELSRVTNDPQSPLLAFLMLAQTEIRLGDPRAALAVLDRASAQFNAQAELAPERIALYRAGGNRAVAESEAQRCQSDRNSKLRTACREALAPAAARTRIGL